MKFKKGTTRFLSLIAAFALTFLMIANPVQVTAAENNPQSLNELFNAEFYATKYPDVVKTVGNGEDALYKHFVEHGINEGRTCSAQLNPKMYRDNYSDISAAFGDDWDDVVKHYFNHGIKENRKSFVSQADLELQNAIDNGHLALADSKDKSSIVNSVEVALKAAAASDNGYAVDPATGIIADKDGHALIPWPTVQEEGRIQDIDELIARCGNDLILVRDENDQIKFVGGRFTDVKVTDETSAIKALDTMADLYGNIDNRTYLKLSDTGADSMGNPYYRFVPIDKEAGYTHDRYTVTLSTDKDGNVLGASNSLDVELYRNGKFSSIAEGWGENLQSELDDPENGYTKLFDEPKLIYDPETRNYFWAMYYEKNGIVNEYLIDTIDGDTLLKTKFYDAETFNSNPEQSFNRDYEFKNLNSPREMTFIDYFNNPVKLPVAYEEGKGWYIVDPERHMVCVETDVAERTHTIDPSKIYDKHYFSDGYFDAVNAFINGGETSDALENEKVIIQAYTTLQATYDEYKEMGMLPNPKTIYVNYKYNDDEDNASHATTADMIVFTINNNAGNADFSGISHEFGHAVVANQGQDLPYQAAIGAINESYADILGNLMKMIKKQEGTYAGNVDYQRWLIGDFLGNDTEHVVRDFSDPTMNGVGGIGKNPAPTQVNDEYFVQDPGKYDNTNDFGGVHDNSSILSHITYRMYNEVIADKGEDGLGKPDMNKYRDLLKIWYDSVVYINNDSTYSDIKGYILQSMKNHGYSSDQIKQTGAIFDDAKVDDYKPFGKGQVSSEIYDKNDMAVAAKVGSKMSGQNELCNYMESANDLKSAEYDLGIAMDELKIAKLQGLSAEELKAYENQIDIARNKVELSKNNTDALYSSFVDSQSRLKNMLDDKMDTLKKQGEELKKMAEAQETNPNLAGAYKALKRDIKSNIETVSDIKNTLDEAVREFSDEEEIMNIFESVWDFDADALSKDELNDNDSDYNAVQDDVIGYDEFWDEYLEALFDSFDFDGLDFDSFDDINWDDLFNDINWDDIFGDDWNFDDDGSDDGDDWNYGNDRNYGDDGSDDWFDFSDFDDYSDEDWDNLIDDIFDSIDDWFWYIVE